jgi:hypothetical protein
MEQKVETKIDTAKMQKLPIINTQDPSKKYSEKEEKHLRELVDFEFMNLEEPGLMHKFAYGNAANKMSFTLFHGAKYKLPRFLARHIESKATPMWTWRPDGSGRLEKSLKGWKSRFQMREVY